MIDRADLHQKGVLDAIQDRDEAPNPTILQNIINSYFSKFRDHVQYPIFTAMQR